MGAGFGQLRDEESQEAYEWVAHSNTIHFNQHKVYCEIEAYS